MNSTLQDRPINLGIQAFMDGVLLRRNPYAVAQSQGQWYFGFLYAAGWYMYLHDATFEDFLDGTNGRHARKIMPYPIIYGRWHLGQDAARRLRVDMHSTLISEFNASPIVQSYHELQPLVERFVNCDYDLVEPQS